MPTFFLPASNELSEQNHPYGVRTRKANILGLGFSSPLQTINVFGELSLDRLEFTQEKYLTNTKELHNITTIKSARYLAVCLLIFTWICNATEN